MLITIVQCNYYWNFHEESDVLYFLIYFVHPENKPYLDHIHLHGVMSITFKKFITRINQRLNKDYHDILLLPYISHTVFAICHVRKTLDVMTRKKAVYLTSITTKYKRKLPQYEYQKPNYNVRAVKIFNEEVVNYFILSNDD